MNRRIPLPALLLGGAGLIPPLLFTAVAVLQLSVFWETTPGLTRSYAAVILSFVGGSWWAFASREERPSWLLIALAVVPALAGWGALMSFQPASALFTLALLYMLLLVGDAIYQARRLTPPWWLSLRVPLSLIMALCCALSGWAMIR